MRRYFVFSREVTLPPLFWRFSKDFKVFLQITLPKVIKTHKLSMKSSSRNYPYANQIDIETVVIRKCDCLKPLKKKKGKQPNRSRNRFLAAEAGATLPLFRIIIANSLCT